MNMYQHSMKKKMTLCLSLKKINSEFDTLGNN